MAHRFFVPPRAIAGDVVTFDAAQAHQLRNVLRLRVGAQVIVFDNSGTEYEATLTALGRDAAAGRIDTRRPSAAEPGVSLTLYQSPIKGERFEWALQKGTELGVAAFVPLLCQRTAIQVRDPGQVEKKRERWERIVREAAEQSGRGRLPRLLPPLSFPDACPRSAQEADLALLPWVEAREGLSATLRGLCAARDPRVCGDRRVALLIGPEGGFAPDEVSLARTCGVRPVSLGPRILRAETAGVVAAAIVLSELGEMG